ncbi:ComF family protein [Sphingomonas ginkgonis]|nr:ComF family protein [Sphingomonas ginkgonis]
MRAFLREAGRRVLDFSLPARCVACGEIVAEVGVFCATCWTALNFLPAEGCTICGLPLEGTEVDTCGACLARPPRIDRIRAAVEYGDISRQVAMKLKYGRKIAVARAMARYMRPLLTGDDIVLVPVPLHRGRLWKRGFNQAVLIAEALARGTGARVEKQLLRRTRPTPSLRGLTALQRRKAVAGAFAVRPEHDIAGRTIVLVDDVYTTGSTCSSCARALKKAGAARVELIGWARVLRPAPFAR